jgi:hypothetical protein
MPPDASPEKAPPNPESRPARSSSDIFGVAKDYWAEKWRNLWKEERNEVRKEVEKRVEKDPRLIEKDGLEFREMKFNVASKAKPEQQLQHYVETLPPPPQGPAQAPDLKKIKTASEMMDELTAGYSAVDKKWLKKYVEATQSLESQGKYEILGVEITQKGNAHFGDRALGKYQPMPKNWMKWSRELFDGKIVEPDRQAQEYVAFKQFLKNFDEMKAKYAKAPYATEGPNYAVVFFAVASRWIGGGSEARLWGKPIPTGGGETMEYAKEILRRMGLQIPLDQTLILEIAGIKARGEKALDSHPEVKRQGKKALEKAKELWKWGKDAWSGK